MENSFIVWLEEKEMEWNRRINLEKELLINGSESSIGDYEYINDDNFSSSDNSSESIGDYCKYKTTAMELSKRFFERKASLDKKNFMLLANGDSGNEGIKEEQIQIKSSLLRRMMVVGVGNEERLTFGDVLRKMMEE